MDGLVKGRIGAWTAEKGKRTEGRTYRGMCGQRGSAPLPGPDTNIWELKNTCDDGSDEIHPRGSKCSNPADPNNKLSKNVKHLGPWGLSLDPTDRPRSF